MTTNKRWPPSLTIEQIRILLDLGLSPQEVAIAAQRSLQTIYNRMSAAGLKAKGAQKGKPTLGRASKAAYAAANIFQIRDCA